MKRITLAAAVLSTALFTADSWAQRPDGERGGGQRDAQGGGERGGGGQRGGGQRGGGGQQQDPAKMVVEMLKEFDKDGDKKLDATELTAMFQSMRERRGGAGGRPGGGERGGAGGRPGGGERGGAGGRPGGGERGGAGGRPGGGERGGASGRPGGDRPDGGTTPQRPEVE